MDRPKIPDAELDLLVALNRLGTATARDLREELSAQRPMAHGSVLTLLARLEAKALVEKEKGPSGKAYVYRPTAEASNIARPLLRRIVDRVFAGSRVSLVATLLSEEKTTAAELDEIQQLLDELREAK